MGWQALVGHHCTVLTVCALGIGSWYGAPAAAQTDNKSTLLRIQSTKKLRIAVVAKVPVDVLRHVVAPHPSVNQIWNPLLAQER